MEKRNSMKYNNNFNILRLLAAYMVLSGHMSVLMGRTPTTILSSPIHELGIFTFFLIGGYLITKSYLSDPDILRYSIKRIFRIFPALITFLIFAVFVSGVFLSTLSWKEFFVHPQTVLYMICNIVLCPAYALPGVFENNPVSSAVNGSLWTLPVEMAMYILIPIMLNLTGIRKQRKYGKIVYVIVTIIMVISGQVKRIVFPQYALVVYGTDWGAALNIIPYYFIGSMFAVCVSEKKYNLQRAIILFLFCIVATGNFGVDGILLVLALPYLIFSLAFATNPNFSKVMQKHEISYGIYLYGFFVQQILLYIFNVKMELELEGIIYLILSFIFTMVLAYFSSIFVEEPLGKVGTKIVKYLKTGNHCFTAKY